MKMIKLTLTTISVSIALMGFISAQPRIPGELELLNLPTNAIIEFTAQSKAWDDDNSILTDASYLDITINNGLGEIYLDFITDDQTGHGPDGTIAYALYKVTYNNSNNNYSFYFDYRDCNYCVGSQLYNATDITLVWNSMSSLFVRNGPNGTAQNVISSGDTITAWGDGFTGNGYSPDVSCFQASTPTSLTALTDQNGHPRFNWLGSEPNGSTYNVWRKMGLLGGYSMIGNNVSSTSYVDYTVTTNSNGFNCRYKINAVNNNHTSPGFSNEIHYQVWNSKQLITGTKTPSVYSLKSAFPNPFNPSVTIPFEMPVASLVSIKIYDAKGQFISLINTNNTSAGYHSIQWDGIL